MTGGDYTRYESDSKRGKSLFSDDDETRRRAEDERAARLRENADRARREPRRERAKPLEPVKKKIDRRQARNSITTPPTQAKEVDIILVDNSSSNRVIADAMKKGTEYLHGVYGGFSVEAALACQFFSDHCDGPMGIFQEVDYTLPGLEGAQVMRASIDAIENVGGGDLPEAIECALYRASQYDFVHVPKERRHLYLVSDQVAHNMGSRCQDDGCPEQRDWRDSLRRVNEVFGTFQVVASGDDREVFDLQKQFIASERRQFDLMNLATSGRINHEERCRLVTNAVLFLIARNRGTQSVEGFLMNLLEKWTTPDEIRYGSDSVARAMEQVAQFTPYLEISVANIRRLLDRVFSGLPRNEFDVEGFLKELERSRG